MTALSFPLPFGRGAGDEAFDDYAKDLFQTSPCVVQAELPVQYALHCRYGAGYRHDGRDGAGLLREAGTCIPRGEPGKYVVSDSYQFLFGGIYRSGWTVVSGCAGMDVSVKERRGSFCHCGLWHG